MQRTKSKILSILLSLVMLLSLLPTTALAADIPDASNVYVDGDKNFYNSTRLYYKNTDPKDAFTGTSTNFNAAYDPATGTLTLQNYEGGAIKLGGTEQKDLTIKLIGNNTITTDTIGIRGNAKKGSITITTDSGSSGNLTINVSSLTQSVCGIDGDECSVTITGSANVIINAKAENASENSYGIKSNAAVSILGSASVNIASKTPSSTRTNACYGIYSKDVAINTEGTIQINVHDEAGTAEAASYGVYSLGNLTLTKVGRMTVKWKKASMQGAPYYPITASFSGTDHAINVDEDKCFASYRHGTPYTVTVNNGDLASPGVIPYAKNNGNFLAGDTVNITPYERKSNSGEEIPFQKWTSDDVTLAYPTTANTSFNVPANAVTVTATYKPFDGAPVFTRTDDSRGTIAFQTAVKPDGGAEYFEYVKVGKENDPYEYRSIAPQPTTTSTTPPYEYSVSASTYNTTVIQYLDAGDYRMAVTLNSERYLSDPFNVDYTAAPTPTANISLDKTGTVDFGSAGEGYTTAPAAKTVTITNNGTAATGPLTITLEGTNAGSFTVSPSSITNIASGGGTDTFTVQPNTGLSAGNYTATVKVSGTGTGVTEQSFDVQFTVTAPATSIAVPAANTGLVYDGTKQTGVNAGTGYTLGGVYEATDVGAVDYTATATLKTGYKWDDNTTGVKTINWNISKRTPIVADFIFTTPTDLTYDGSDKTASVTLRSPLTKSGAITPTYMKGGSVVAETKDVGTYTVKIDVAGGDNFNAGSDLTDSAWKFSITPANQNAPTGLGVAAPTASSGNGKITGTTDKMEYNTNAAATSGWTACSTTETEVAPGTYYVRYKADANHNAGTAATVTVPAYGATKYTVTVTYDANGTASADKTTDVVAGETVTLTATPNSGYVFDKWDNKTPSDLSIGTDGKFTMPGANVSVKATFKGAALTGTASITGTLKYGQELTATLTGDNNTGNLDYKWYQNGTTQVAANNTGKYTLRADDIGKTITVKITSSVQTGEITSAATAAVAKADGPAAPTAFTLTFTPNSDGTTFTATIPAFAGGEYSFDGATYSTTNTKTDCAANTSYTGYARIKETATHEASAATSSTQTSPKLTVATPTFTPNGASSFTGTQSVYISCATAGATIHYTTNGTAPTASSPVYSTALSLTSTTTVKAIAVMTDMNDSAIATATFTKYSGGGGGGGGSYTPSYTVSVDKTENGTITVSPKSASKGDTVTITVKPDKGYELDTLKVLDKNGDKVKLTEKNGKYTFTMPTGKVTVKGSFVEEAPVQIFKDVPVDAYYYEAVKWAAEKGITGGVGNGLFAPNQPCTRAQIVTFLWRAAGSPAPKHMSSFADVPADAFYAKAVAWAVENGITGGTGDGKFSPDATCTRAQSVTFLYRAAGSPKVSGSAEFGDVATNAYYADAVAWAAKSGITGGIGGGLFGSGNDCTRAQIVTFLYRNYQSK